MTFTPPGRQHHVSTYALIPGAGGAAWYWHPVVPFLEKAGHDVVAGDLPADDPQAGLPEYASIVTAAIAGHDDVILVAQSLGGFTAPLVAAQADLSALVFVNAMIPVPGETAGAWWDDTGAPAARIAAAEQAGYSTEFDLDTYFLHDVPPDVAASGAQHQHDEADIAFGAPCDFDAWPDIPIRVVAGAGDRFFPAAFQQAVARDRLGVQASFLPGGHLMALSQPAALAGYLLDRAAPR
jgi:alpha-beta hydrolase superfamily lysophospholipase